MKYKCALTGKVIESDVLPSGWVYPPKNWDLIRPIMKETITEQVPEFGTIICLSSESALKKLSAQRVKESLENSQVDYYDEE